MRRLACVAVVLLAGSATAQTNLLVNPSFEQPPQSAVNFQPFYTGETVGAGWVVQSGIVDVVHTDFDPGRTQQPGPTAGIQYGYIGDGPSAAVLSQSVALSPGAYRLTFDMSNLLDKETPAQLDVDVLLDGLTSVTGGPTTFTRPAHAGYAAQALDFTLVTAGTYQLVLDSPTGGVPVDNFSLTPVPERPRPVCWRPPA